MADEQVTTTPVTDTKPVTKEEQKLNIVKKIIDCVSSVMKAAFSKGDADTVWYKKGLYYTVAGILGIIVYAFTYHGIEIIDWLTALVSNLF